MQAHISACSMVQPVGNPDKKWDAIVQNIHRTVRLRSATHRRTVQIGNGYELQQPLHCLVIEGITAVSTTIRMWRSTFIPANARWASQPNNWALQPERLPTTASIPSPDKAYFDGARNRKITSMISTVGFYEHSGDWMYTAGIPAKSGVGGGVMAVLPGVMGRFRFRSTVGRSR